MDSQVIGADINDNKWVIYKMHIVHAGKAVSAAAVLKGYQGLYLTHAWPVIAQHRLDR